MLLVFFSCIQYYLLLLTKWTGFLVFACLTIIQIACILVESGKKLPAGAVPIIGLQPEVKGV